MIPTFDHFKYPKRCTETYVKNNFPELYQKLNELTVARSFSEKMYLFYHGMSEPPKCPCCDKYAKFTKLKHGYRIHCSNYCQRHDPNNVIKCEQTKLERYGDKHYRNSEKIKQTCLERYGVEHGFQSEQAKEKAKKTKLERYGDEYYCNREKNKQTCLERYGVEYSFQSEQAKEKAKKTKLERYGVEHTMMCQEVREKAKKTKLERYGSEKYTNSEKRKQTLLERYGVDNPMKSEIFQQRAQETNLKKYGVRFPMQNEESSHKNILKRNKLFAKRYNLSKIENGIWYVNCPHPECNECQEKVYKITSSQYFARRGTKIEPCTNLLPINPSNSTYIELFVRDILDKYNITYLTNDRRVLSGQELDIYIPDKKIAIECNGIYWHSVNHNPESKNWCDAKFNKCCELGIQLLTIWEDQINRIPEIVESVILSKIGIYKTKIGARKCEVKEIDSKTCNNFLEANHIQGSTNASVHLGLFYENQLVSVMTFSKQSKLSGFSKDVKWELSRFCTILNTQILGGADKLLQYFIRNYQPESIISFASNDISNGRLYKKLGFTERERTKSYWYVFPDTNIRYHRTKFTKSKLKQLGYDTENKTEEEIMLTETRYLKICDTGHTKYMLNLK